MPNLTPYLTFDGNCVEAMRFYERVLDGKLEKLLTHGESPVADQMPPGNADRVMHASLVFEGGNLFAGDAPVGMGMPFDGMKGFSVTLSFDDTAEAERVFNALCEGNAKVIMPFEPTFWAEKFGMVTDRFGTPWIVNGAMLQF